MKKSLIALAAFAATSAFSQSTVTLSGVMDAGAVYNSATAVGASKLGIGGANNSRLIFAGSEDLGGGLRATFAAQLRFDIASGTNERGSAGFNGVGAPSKDGNGANLFYNSGTALLPVFTNLSGVNYGRPLFQGETRIGLRGDFGAIRIGRGLTALQAPNGGAIDPWGVSTVASSVYAPGYVSDYVQGGEGRTDGFFYDTPNFSGLSASLTFSPRKVPAGVAASTATIAGKPFYSVAVNYNNGPINAVVGYEQNRYGDSLMNLGGNYDLGSAKLFMGYGAVKGGDAANRVNVPFLASGAAAPGYAAGMSATVLAGAQPLGLVGAGTKTNAFSVGATVPFGAAKVLAGFSTYKSNIVGAQRDSKLGLGVNYALSKRTSVYSDLASFSRKNNNPGVNPASNNDRVTQMDLGILHTF